MSYASGAERSRILERGLEAEGLSVGLTTTCARCNGPTDPSTDGMGRSVDECRACGHRSLIPLLGLRPAPADGYVNRAMQHGCQRPKRGLAAPTPTDDPAIELLRDVRKARAEAPMNPALLAAKREFDQMESDAREARKGGRRANPFHVGRSPPRRKPLDLAPALPRETPPPAHRPPAPAVIAEPERPMKTTQERKRAPAKFSPKPCDTCSQQFAPRGSKSKTCDDCLGQADAPAKPPRMAATHPSPAETSHVSPPRSAKSSTGSNIAGAIAAIREELDGLEVRAGQLRQALVTLESLGV